MYLTKMELKPNRIKQLKDINNLAQAHQWLARSLYYNDQKPGRYLWDLNITNDKIGNLILLSQQKPNKKILMKYGREQTIYTEPYIFKLTRKTDIPFKLIASPSKRIYGHNHSRVPLLNPIKQKQWLQRKADNGGFKIKTLKIVDQKSVFFQHHNLHASRINKITFAGTLDVTNIKKFEYTITHGIGPEKSYGFGFLQLEL